MSTRNGQAHMVLLYSAHDSADPLILDNLDNTIRPASQRPDLVPVYAFNDDVEVARTGSQGSPTHLRMRRALLRRMQEEQRG